MSCRAVPKRSWLKFAPHNPRWWLKADHTLRRGEGEALGLGHRLVGDFSFHGLEWALIGNGEDKRQSGVVERLGSELINY